MSITIKDIAKLAGVSHTTVSRALNDNPIIKEETRNRIKKIAAENNYIPNYNAKSLKLDRSFNVGLFFTTIEGGTTTSFFHDAIKGCNGAIHTKGYNLVVKGIEDYNGDYSSVNIKRFDGIIVVSQSKTDDEFIKHVIGNLIPTVVVNRKIEFGEIDNIIYDDMKGALTATEYLISKGHKEIAFIKGKKEFANTSERDNGYKQALEDNGILYNELLTEYGEYDLKSGYEAMEKILKRAIPTAIFCSNDEMALGAIKALLKRGIKVPEDCSVIGFDNTSLCEFATPELTSVNRSIEDMVSIAAIKLLDIMSGGKPDHEHNYLDCDLVKRKSVMNR
ncbi:MAG: LacI family DNA-binding transcriptional regulator [Clostridiales bacterium]|nr:LacI family DNA-binding transcriptional regulator [Clostridiales bacterium]